jgi:hypothetical protein
LQILLSEMASFVGSHEIEALTKTSFIAVLLGPLLTYLSWNRFTSTFLIMSMGNFIIFWTKSSWFWGVYFIRYGTNWFLTSDKQLKMKVLISPFYGYVEYLNIRLSFSFEHTDNISTRLVLMKAYFKLKKAIVFYSQTSKENVCL